MRNSNTLGAFIKELRLKNQYTIKELSEITMISENYIERIENDIRKNPSKIILERLADVFNVNRKELIKFIQ